MYSEAHSGSLEIAMRIFVLILCFSLLGCAKPARFASVIPEMITVEGEEFEVKTIVVGDDTLDLLVYSTIGFEIMPDLFIKRQKAIQAAEVVVTKRCPDSHELVDLSQPPSTVLFLFRYRCQQN